MMRRPDRMLDSPPIAASSRADALTRSAVSATTASRRQVVVLLSAFSLVGYVLRMNISVAAPFMMTTLHLDKIQMGEVFSAFMVGYALFQIPWGVSGDQLGSGRMLTWSAVLWAVTTLLTGLVPGLLLPAGVASLASLLLIRFLLGVGQAAAYPLAARAIVSAMPSTRRASSFAALIVGMAIGSAFTPPLVSWAMVTLGWRAAFYLCALLALGLAVVWHRVAGASLDTAPAGGSGPARGFWWSLGVLKDPNVAWMSLSYFCDSYVLFMFVFWLFLYLEEQRGMSVMASGLYGALPFVAGLILSPLAGLACDALAVRWPGGWGRRSIAMASLLLSAMFLLVGVNVASPVAAITGLSLAVGFLLCTETAYWSTSMDLGGARAGTAGGVMNMAGNLGGVVSTSLVPILIAKFGWPFAFQSAAGLAVFAAAIWLLVHIEPTPEAGRLSCAATEA
jgi:ACS family glucarate transporter-like MFS transporter